MIAAVSLHGFADFLVLAATLVGAIAAASAITEGMAERWRRTWGRRAEGYRRLARLGTSAQLSFFTAVLGQPPAMRTRSDRGLSEWIYVDRDYFVQAIVEDVEESVVAFSITTRSRKFKPKLVSAARSAWPRLEVRLGVTRFGALPILPERLAWSRGARRWSYFEEYYLGNPGSYQRFVLSVNDAGASAWDGDQPEIDPENPNDFVWAQGDESDPGEQMSASLRAFRAATRMNTFTVIRLGVDDYPFTHGPNQDHVRTLP